MTHRQASIAHPLQLHLVPLLQVINFVLALLHALVRRLVAAAAAVLLTATTNAPLAHHLRHFFPIPPSQISPTQLVELLRVRVQKASNRHVAPFLSVLPVIAAAAAAAVILRPARRFAFIVVVVVVVLAGIVSGRRAGFQLLAVIGTLLGGRRSSDGGSGYVRIGVLGERRGREVITVSGVRMVVARGRVEVGVVVDEREVLGRSHGKKAREERMAERRRRLRG